MVSIFVQVGRRIRYYRKALGYTQENLGAVLNLDQSYVGRIERGEINITLETLQKISEALQVLPHQLLEINENHPTKSEISEELEKINLTIHHLKATKLRSIHKIIKEILVFNHDQ